eukprot:COSAG02_NODE_39777_length_413_cov_0.633758_1_plen_20_part_01
MKRFSYSYKSRARLEALAVH